MRTSWLSLYVNEEKKINLIINLLIFRNTSHIFTTKEDTLMTAQQIFDGIVAATESFKTDGLFRFAWSGDPKQWAQTREEIRILFVAGFKEVARSRACLFCLDHGSRNTLRMIFKPAGVSGYSVR